MATAELQITNHLFLTKKLLQIAIFSISYIRGLFPEKYFTDESVPELDMDIKQLMPMDAESRRLIDWMEKGVYDALEKNYLKSLVFCVCETVEGAMMEEYSIFFSYSNSDSQEVSMNINRTGIKKGRTFKCNLMGKATTKQMRSSACKMVRVVVHLMRTLNKMTEERTILMKLFYYDDITPMDYKAPFFKGCTEDEAQHTWTKILSKMEGNSVLDAWEYENLDDDDVSLGCHSMHHEEYSEPDTDQCIVTPEESWGTIITASVYGDIGTRKCGILVQGDTLVLYHDSNVTGDMIKVFPIKKFILAGAGHSGIIEKVVEKFRGFAANHITIEAGAQFIFKKFKRYSKNSSTDKDDPNFETNRSEFVLCGFEGSNPKIWLIFCDKDDNDVYKFWDMGTSVACGSGSDHSIAKTLTKQKNIQEATKNSNHIILEVMVIDETCGGSIIPAIARPGQEARIGEVTITKEISADYVKKRKREKAEVEKQATRKSKKRKRAKK